MRCTVNQLLKSAVREIRMRRSVGAGGGQLSPATRWAKPRGFPLSRFHPFNQCDMGESESNRVWSAWILVSLSGIVSKIRSLSFWSMQ